MNILIANSKGDIRDSFLTQEVLNELSKLGNVFENPYERELTTDELADYIKGKDVVLTGWGGEPISEDVMKNADCLKLHAHVGGSVAPYISKAEFDSGITILSGNEIFARSVAEGCICYILSALRSIPEYVDNMKLEGWTCGPEYSFQGLLYKKFGMIGYGTISKYLCEMLKPFHIELLIYSSHEVDEVNSRMASLDEIFSTCDIISVHSAWNKKTEGMINAGHLSKIKDGALFVNTARAPIVVEQDLYTELKKERFKAVLDVYYNEPLPMDDPLRGMKNVMLLPHVAGPTMDMRKRVGIELTEDIKRFIKGEECHNKVTAEQASRMTIIRKQNKI